MLVLFQGDEETVEMQRVQNGQVQERSHFRQPCSSRKFVHQCRVNTQRSLFFASQQESENSCQHVSVLACYLIHHSLFRRNMAAMSTSRSQRRTSDPTSRGSVTIWATATLRCSSTDSVSGNRLADLQWHPLVVQGTRGAGFPSTPGKRMKSLPAQALGPPDLNPRSVGASTRFAAGKNAMWYWNLFSGLIFPARVAFDCLCYVSLV